MLKRKGFTLIELLVVIAIVAILAAILFPIFTKAKERSKAMRCLSNLKEIANAMRMYGGDWTGRFPIAVEWGGSPNLADKNVLGQYAGQSRSLTGPIDSRAKGIWICPADIGNGVSSSDNTPYWKTYGDTSYGWPGVNYKGFGAGMPYLGGLSQDNPVDMAAASSANAQWKWIWSLPISKRQMVFDHNPWHYMREKGKGDRFNTTGLNNVVYCDGHVKPVDYQRFQAFLWGPKPADIP